MNVTEGNSIRLRDNLIATKNSTNIVGPALVLFSTLFNAGLCLLYTLHIVSINTSTIAAIQLIVLMTALFYAKNSISSWTVQAYFLVVLFTLVLKMFNKDLDLKVLFDVGLIPIFVLLGRQSSIPQAHRLVEFLLIMVAVFGMIEMIFPDWFQKFFNIWDYYVDKGVIDASSVNYNSGNFFGNGERAQGAGRTLFPMLLTNHRAGSIFLESVSAGNFPVICLAWMLSISFVRSWRIYVTFLLVGLCIVLPDSRFAATCCVLLIGVRLTGLQRSRIFAASLPFAAAAVLWVWGSLQPQPVGLPRVMTDDFAGRLLFSGRSLAFWTWRNWQALEPSPVVIVDNGYGYIVSNLGLIGACFAWLCFALTEVRSRQAQTMRGLISLYISFDLCIGTSVFSLKTAALLWFLYGATQSNQCKANSGSFSIVKK